MLMLFAEQCFMSHNLSSENFGSGGKADALPYPNVELRLVGSK